MAFDPYPFPSYTWDYQGFDFAGMAGLDASLAQAMYDDGVRVVGRYLFGQQYPNGKGLSAAEAQLYLNAGISIFLYYEVNSNDALGGQARGEQLGQQALAQAAALGVPQGTPIICCCDTGVTDAQANGVVMQFLQGFASQLPDYRIGIYGGANVMQACYNTDPDYWRVQAGAWGADEFSDIDVRQWLLAKNGAAIRDGYCRISNITIQGGYAYWRGRNVDLISAVSLEFMWNPGSTPTPPSPTPPPPPPVPPVESDKMPIWFYLKLF